MQNRALQPYFLLAVLGIAFVLTFFIFQPFLGPLVLGTIFAVVLHPLYLRIRDLFKGRETLAALATVFLTIVVILIPTSVLGVQLLKEAQQLYESVSAQGSRVTLGSMLDGFGPVVEKYVPGAQARIQEFSSSIDSYASSALTWLIGHIGVAFSSLAALTLDLFLFFITLYYLLRDGQRLKETLVQISPLADTDDETIFSRLALAVNSVVKGKLAISLIQGIMTGIGFALFGVPNAVLWGLVAAIASIVPPVGTALVLAPGVAYLAVTGHMGAALGLAIWGAVAVGLVDNLLGPKLMGAGMQLHPLLVLLSVLGGIVYFGPVGVFLGPLTVSLLLVLLSIYRDVMKRNREHTATVLP